MHTVFVVQHEYERTLNIDGTEIIVDNTKFIGVYSSREGALRIVEYLRKQPGFIDYPNDFYISEYELNKDHWPEGFGVGEHGLE